VSKFDTRRLTPQRPSKATLPRDGSLPARGFGQTKKNVGLHAQHLAEIEDAAAGDLLATICLTADGVSVRDSRLLCIPVLVDAEGGASSPEDRVFVDAVHVALTRKDSAQVFDVPLPPSISGDSVHRAM